MFDIVRSAWSQYAAASLKNYVSNNLADDIVEDISNQIIQVEKDIRADERKKILEEYQLRDDNPLYYEENHEA